MTTEPLHTKYRPRTFDQVIGQESAIAALSSALAHGQRAFLLEGPSGTGKTTLARICASHEGCSEVVEIDAATHTGVDAMRDVASRAAYRTLSGSGRAIIVDECHRLSKQAWDSLLKDIEEPPEGTYWFFCTTESTKVPKTIQTRCARAMLEPLTWRQVARIVSNVAEAEGFDLSEEILEAVVDAANGSARQALVSLSLIASCKTVEEARSILKQAPVTVEAYDLAKLLVRQTYSFEKAVEILKSIKDASPEGIRQVVRAYMTTVILNSPDNRWARGVLLAFEKPAIEENQVSDILCRLITLEKWKR